MLATNRRRYQQGGDSGDYSLKYFTLEANTAGTITWTSYGNSPAGVTLEYSINEGTWTSITSANPAAEINVSAGDKVRFRGNGCNTADVTWSCFGGTAEVEAYGNTMSLLYGDNFVGQTTISSFCFYSLFYYYSELREAGNLILPATRAYESCYESMFENSGIYTAPELPATRVDEECYAYMFYNCTLLTTGPSDLPATTAGRKCYYSMFKNCDWLYAAPASINLSLSGGGYSSGHNCEEMFYMCRNLRTSPVINMSRLPGNSCEDMFYGCRSLNYVTCLATTIYSGSCTNWLKNVAATGTFVKARSMTDWQSGVDGIPTGWTVVDAS